MKFKTHNHYRRHRRTQLKARFLAVFKFLSLAGIAIFACIILAALLVGLARMVELP